MAESKTCNVCCEEFNKSNHKEIHCNNCDYSVCKTCARTYLTSTTSDPKCMNCNVAWNRNYMVMNLNRSYMEKEYRQHRRNVLVDAEMARMPDTVRFAEEVKVAKDLEKDNVTYRQQIKDLQNQINKLNTQIHRNSRRIAYPHAGEGANADEGQAERNKFVMACPHEGCRGFLSSAYKCGLCNMFTCPDCLMIIGENKNEEHKCNEDNVKSAEMIKKDTKPCPACGERIFKIMGCDQMFCTSIKKDGGGVCGTAFSWRTGKIETGTIHNPHFYELQRQGGGGGGAVRNPGDVLCGGVPDVRYFGQCLAAFLSKGRTINLYQIHNQNQELMIHHLDLPVLEDIYGIHQFASELNQYELPRLRREVTDLNDHRDIRIKYLLKEITKEEMSKQVDKNDVIRQKKAELLNVMEILGVTGIEFLNDLFTNINLHNIISDTNQPTVRRYMQVSGFQRKMRDITEHDWHQQKSRVIKEINGKLEHLKNVIKYCNEQFKIIGVTYNCMALNIPERAEVAHRTFNSPYDRLRAIWKFQRKKYCIKDIKS